MKLPPRTYSKKFNEQHGRCFYCGHLLSNGNIEIDHIIPFSISKNGQIANLCLSCGPCNRLKSHKSLNEFRNLILELMPEKLIRGMFYYEFINIYPRG